MIRKNHFRNLLGLSLLTLATACIDKELDDPEVLSEEQEIIDEESGIAVITSLDIPENFVFETERVVQVNIDDVNEGTQYYIFKYDQEQVDAFESDLSAFDFEENLIYQGVVASGELTAFLTLPSTNDQLFVVYVGEGNYNASTLAVTGSELAFLELVQQARWYKPTAKAELL